MTELKRPREGEMDSYLNTLSLSMHLPVKRIFSDIKEIAWRWEIIIEEMNRESIYGHAVLILHGLVHAYLRGGGYRMGNIQGYRRHSSKYVLLCMEVTKYVIEEGSIIFPALHAYGFSSPEKAFEVIRAEVIPQQNDILTAAEEILQEKQSGD